MKSGIYAITNLVDGKMYVGKSIDMYSRWTTHLSILRREVRSRDCNRHLFNAFKKYGEKSFIFECLEFVEPDDVVLAEKELDWITKLDTLNRDKGYNLRLDSKTKCIVHDETRLLISKAVAGVKNPNYGNNWSDDQKKRASKIAVNNHKSGRYSSEETRRKHSEWSVRFWKDNPEKKESMKRKVSLKRTTYKIAQHTRDGILLKVWDTMMDIIDENPDYYKIAIYNCINGHKPTYRGFVWRKVI